MARVTTVHHIPAHKGWPDGEKPSGWPGADPSRNVRDEYDRQRSQLNRDRDRDGGER